MDDFAGFLGRLAWPLVSRVLAAMGFGYVTYEGASSAVDSALSAAKGALAGLGADVLQIMALSGFFEAMAITSGGIVSGLAWMAMKKMALQTTGASSASAS